MRRHALCKQFLVIGICMLMSTIGYPIFAAEEMPVGSTIPKFDIPMPASPEAQAYLGIKGEKSFQLSDIQAKMLVVEFFSPFCPVCQQHAPKANKIYNFIQGDSVLSKDVRMIGLSLLKDEYALKVYKKNFKVKFPLIADTSGEMQEKSGVVHIPITVVTDKNGKILSSHLGKVNDLDAYMGEIKKLHKGL